MSKGKQLCFENNSDCNIKLTKTNYKKHVLSHCKILSPEMMMKNFIFTLLMSSIATKHFLVQTEGKILVLYINRNAQKHLFK